jgi:penicillin G amidase
VSPRRGLHRDCWGIPHVVGDDLVDLARLQGSATATDRTWQLEHARRRATGRTAEVLGPAVVDWDVFARRAGLDLLARRAYETVDPETRAFVAAYVDGVNEVLPHARCAELDLLGIEAAPWDPWTPLAVFAAVHVLFSTFPAKLWRSHAHRVLGPEAAALFHDEGLDPAGSNAWVIGGGRTRSGRPLLAGDPHRAFEDPNVYLQVRLTCPAEAIDVAGFTFAGVPGVQHFAHAGSVAWGITNAMADYQDLYVEELQRHDGSLRSREPDGWAQVPVDVQRVEVRGAEPVDVEVVRTGRGPVVLEDDLGRGYSLRTPSDVLGDLGFDSLLPLLRARTADDVVAAFASWVEPVNNLLVADDAGAVRHRVVGRVPRRADVNRWLPVPAVSPGHQWHGWVELPGRDVGPHEHVVTANQRMPGFDEIGVEFAPPARAQRIDALLAGRDHLTVADCEALHGDVLAGQPALLHEALRALDGLDGPAEVLRRRVAAWDQRFTADSTDAAAYVAVRDELVRLIASSPALAGLEHSPYPGLLDRWMSVDLKVYLSLPHLLGREALTLLPDRDDLLRAAVSAVASGNTRHARAATWGQRHRYRPPRAVDALAPDGLRERLPEPGLPGDNDCVRCAGQVPGSNVAVRGSVARYAWDLSGLEGSGWVVPLGADGRPGHPHRADQLPSWVEARLVGVTGMERVTPGPEPTPSGGL